MADPGQVNLGSAFAGPVGPPDPTAAEDLSRIAFAFAPPSTPPQAQPHTGGMGSAAASMYAAPSGDLRDAQPTAGLLANYDRGPAIPPAGPSGPEVPVPPPTRPMTALEQATAENQAYAQTLAEYLAANPVQTVTSRNPMRPIVERGAAFAEGGGQLPLAPFEFVPPKIPRNEGETDEEYAARMQPFAETAYREQLDEYQRKAAEKQAAAQQLGDVRDIGTPGNLGMREAQLQAAENLGQAQIDQQLAVTTAQTQAAESQRAAIEAARAAEQERRAFAQQQRDAMIQLQETEKAARAKIDALPEHDGQRFFKSLKGGQRFWGILGAVLSGSVGIDVAEQFRQAALDDLEEQKANAAQVFAQGDKASADVQQASTIYQDLIRSSGDESVADSMWIKLQMEDAATELERVLSQTTEPVLRAQLQQDLVNLRQQIFDEEQKIEYTRATTPWAISTTYDPIGRKNRERVVKQIDKAQEQGFELTKLGIAGEEKALDRGIEQEKVRADREIKAARGEGGYQKEAQWYAKEVGPYVAVNASLATIVDRYKAQDIPGRGLGAYFWSEEGRALREDIKLTMKRQLRSDSGAVLGDDEIEREFEEVYSGLGDGELLSNLERKRNSNAYLIQGVRAGISPDAADFYDNNLRRGGINPSVQSIGGTPSEDAARLGGRVVQ